MNNNYKNIEIIVVNDGSTDNTVNIIESLKSRCYKNGYKVILLNQGNLGKAKALNMGVKNAKGEIIITIDADSYITPNTIKNLIEPFCNPKYDVSIGQIQVGNRKTLLGLIQYLEYTFGFHYKKAQSILGSIYIFPGALSAFRKSVIEKVGYYEYYSCTEDLDLSMKIRDAGYNVCYVENALCITEGPSDFFGLLNQRIRWRHGFLQCVLFRKNFLFSFKKGKYLSIIEVPLSILGLFEILVFPFFFLFTYSQIYISQDYLLLLFSYLLLPYSFLLLRDNKVPLTLQIFLGSLLIPILFPIINIIEFVALIGSLYRIFLGGKTKWTSWNRQGV